MCCFLNLKGIIFSIKKGSILKKISQRDMAGHLGITTVTLRNWRKHKPNLYEIVLKGFAFDEAVNASKENYEKLKELATRVKHPNG